MQKYKRFGIALKDDLYQKLRLTAFKQRRRMAQIMREAVEMYLKEVK